MEIFNYEYIKTTYNQQPFEEIVEYGLKIPCINKEGILDYIFKSYRYKEYLYITDIFPKMYENDNKCFQHIISREGYTVNMRKLSVSCLVIFVKHFIGRVQDSAMVISGSYEIGEPTEGMSRKLKLYWYFFSPLFDTLGLRSVNMFDKNAFILVHKNNSHTDGDIRQEYMNFKSTQKLDQHV